MEGIPESVLREFALTKSIRSAQAVGRVGGYVITIRCGQVERILLNTRGGVRLFTLETATLLLREIGVLKFEVDSSSYQPGRIRKPRPDRAEALRKTRTRLRQAALV